jgi:hypothetical protein
MMKRIVILLGLMLLFRESIHGQVCNDTLIWKIDFQYLGIIAPTGTPLNDYSKTIFIVGCFQSIGSPEYYGTEEVDASLSDSGEAFVIDCRISPIISSEF